MVIDMKQIFGVHFYGFGLLTPPNVFGLQLMMKNWTLFLIITVFLWLITSFINLQWQCTLIKICINVSGLTNWQFFGQNSTLFNKSSFFGAISTWFSHPWQQKEIGTNKQLWVWLNVDKVCKCIIYFMNISFGTMKTKIYMQEGRAM